MREDYIVILTGTINIETTEGNLYELKQGDFTVTVGNVHRFVNKTNEWGSESFGSIFPLQPRHQVGSC